MPILDNGDQIWSQEFLMRCRFFTAVSVGSVAVLIGALLAVQRLSLSWQVRADERPALQVTSAEAYTPESDDPKGLRVTAGLDIAELQMDATRPFELDVSLSKQLAEKFVVADAAVWSDVKDRHALVPELQPYHNQAPPKGVHARLLFSPMKRAKYNLDIYLAPKDAKTDPEQGLEYLSSADDRNRNVRVVLLNQ